MNIYILNRVGLLWKQNSVINLVFHFFYMQIYIKKWKWEKCWWKFQVNRSTFLTNCKAKIIMNVDKWINKNTQAFVKLKLVHQNKNDLKMREMSVNVRVFV